MTATTSIEWTRSEDGTAGKTWNPVRGCSIVSPGCVNCYAMKQAHRFSGEGKPYHGLTKQTKAGPQWTGAVRCVDEALEEPLHWRKPARIFVNSMSDLFHEDVPDAFIDRVFAVMGLCPRHTFQVLTKRAARMVAYFDGGARERIALVARANGLRQWPLDGQPQWVRTSDVMPWPLPNVQLIVSAEDQPRADERIPFLLQIPAAVRGVSLEPLLGPVDLSRWLPMRLQTNGWNGPEHVHTLPAHGGARSLDWVIVGGESGPGARPFHVAWANDIIRQCGDAGVLVFCKQMGSNPVGVKLHDRKGGNPAEWPAGNWPREFPNAPRS